MAPTFLSDIAEGMACPCFPAVQDLSSTAFQEKMDLASNEEKSTVLLQELQSIFSTSEGDGATLLESAFEQLRVAAQRIAEKGPEDAEIFAEKCNRFVLGATSTPANWNSEVLLDLCAVNQAKCLEEPGSQHITCACAAHPAMGLGDAPKLQEQLYLFSTIPGSSRRRAGRAAGSCMLLCFHSRRLASQELATYHVCAEVWEQAGM